MPFQWLFGPKQESESATDVPGLLSFDDIASSLEFYKRQYETTEKLLKEAQSQISERRNEVTSLNNALQREKSANTTLRKQDQSRKANWQHLQNDLSRLGGIVQRQNAQISQLKAEYDALSEHALKTAQKAQDSQLELEYLKCTSTPDAIETRLRKSTTLLVPQPFVVVLVDGDAYAWAPDLFLASTGTTPGAQAAIRLRNEVTRFILDHPEIPSVAKVIARVFINESGFGAAAVNKQKAVKHQLKLMNVFMRNFTEAMPLFDFVDVGPGKERADEKIRENFHLYLSNPHCHRIFVAACNDNGFARMLEPYQGHTNASEKVVLVSSGHIVHEIQKLSFNEVTWPSVFALRAPSGPPSQYLRQKQLEERKRLALKQAEAHDKELGLSGVRDKVTAILVINIVGSLSRNDINRSIQSYAGGIRLRYSASISKAQDQGRVIVDLSEDENVDSPD